MPQPLNLPLNCPKCGKPLSIRLQLPRQFTENQQALPQTICCLYPDCDGKISVMLHGEITATWIGHGLPES